jgi:hypothetical protein
MKLQDCQNVIDRICPEVSSAYLIETDTFVAPGDAGAFSIRGPHQESRAYLEQRGEWRGWKTGFVIFIQPPNLGTLLHEAAHLIPAKVIVPKGIDKPTAKEKEFQDLQLKVWAQGHSPIHRPWEGHAWQFVRACLHLHYRLGADAPPLWDVFDGGNYGLSDIMDYQDRLGVEPISQTTWPFSEIIKTDPPKPFIELFARDVRRWFSRLAEKEIENANEEGN